MPRRLPAYFGIRRQNASFARAIPFFHWIGVACHRFSVCGLLLSAPGP